MDNRIRALDGIRGIAILLVLATHIFKRAGYLTSNSFLVGLGDFFRIGWVGVDLFFVLSGYLITSILVNTRETPHYFKNFYARRILRIFPLYYATLLIIFPLLPWLDKSLGPPTQAAWPVFLVYLQNWLYVIGREPSNAVGVTWSLAIEEQFYLLWPLVVCKVAPRNLAKWTFGFLVFILALRIGLFLFTPAWPNLNDLFYYASFIRLDGLLTGALLALGMRSEVWRTKIQRWVGPVFWICLSALTLILLVGPPTANRNNPALMTIGYTLLAVFFASWVSLALLGAERNPLRRLFDLPGLAFWGKYSYALYLFHLPIATLLLNYFWQAGRKNALVWLEYSGLTIAITVALALISWNGLEKRVLSLKHYFE